MYGKVYVYYNFQIHPWLPIINGVHQEDEEIEMVTKGEKNKKAEESNTKDDNKDGIKDNDEENKHIEMENMDNEYMSTFL